MTTTTDRPAPRPGGLRGLLRGGAGIAVAMAVMNISTYGYQLVAARRLGPTEYGAVASLMALLMVLAVVQLGLQATAARRISATPANVAQIERVIMAVTYRAALVVGAVMLLAAPLVHRVLRLDSVWPAVFIALAAVPLTIQGGQAGILQGERRWLPLGLVYLGVGVPRLLIGSICIAIEPSESAAMLGVLLGLLAPVAAGWIALRRPRDAGEHSPEHAGRAVTRETFHASMALLAFFVLSNIDILVARNVLDSHDAGLYAGGLILTKATLFLPQFVVVVAFPAMSTVSERRATLLRSLVLVLALGIATMLGVLLLPDLAMLFVGGHEYDEVSSLLWLFAMLGTFLSMLQLLVYSVLARQGTRTAYLIWAAVVVLVAVGAALGSLGGLLATVALVDGVLLVGLLVLSLWRMNRLVSVPPGGLAPGVSPPG
ncbi:MULTISPECIES: polysaccharide biosynthesis protein [unclassified Nocardioides]|uniref:polysaccharide biosynthesis protein n=1 Tax=unclassified Nocardioides TaxID=2615069 RepID=UPI0030151871